MKDATRRILLRAMVLAGRFGPRPEILPSAGGRILRWRGNVWIDTATGHAISGAGGLLEESLPLNWPFDRGSLALQPPDPVRWVRARLAGAGQDLGRVVSLRHVFEHNYFHFHFDVLGKLAAFGDDDAWRSAPLLLAPGSDTTAFTAEVLREGTWPSLKWTAPRQALVRCSELVVPCFWKPYRARMDVLRAGYGWQPAASTGPGRRLFVYRPEGVHRSVVESAALAHALSQRGFEAVDPGALPIARQREVFADAEAVVTVHGASMTNLIHCRRPNVHVLEIVPPYPVSEDMMRICEAAGFPLSQVRGRPLDGGVAGQAFSVDPAEVLAHLDARRIDGQALQG